MRLTKLFAVVVIFPAAMLCAAGSFAQSQPQGSVADAARKAREQKKNEPKPAKVITNDDLAASSQAVSGTQPGTPPAATSPEQPAAAEQVTEQAPASEDKGEKYWRKRFADARAELALAEKELDVLQKEWQRDQRQFYVDPQKAMQEQHDRKELNEHSAAIEAKKKQVEQLKQKISGLEDELRAAGGDSGWAR